MNLLNLNRPGVAIYGDADGWDEASYLKKVDWTASTITRLGARVWGFQELWHRGALEEVFERVQLDTGYRLLAPADHAGEKIICAAAVEEDLLVGEPEWIEGFPAKFVLRSGGDDAQTPEISVSIDAFSRPVLRFRVRPRADGVPITVYVAHFKSKRPTDLYREGWYRDDDEYYGKHREGLGAAVSTIRRTAEATALRMMIVDEIKGNNEPVVVLGDLNDGAHSNTLDIVTGQPNYLRSALSEGGSDTDLYAVGALQALRSLRDVYYTHVYQDTMETLDHILVSQEFYDQSRQRIWALRGVEVLNDHLNREDHKESGTTDHGVVRAEFEYRPA
jgi:endonuclease/exonuclease/phosphatase family metal-dependent hydrolase